MVSLTRFGILVFVTFTIFRIINRESRFRNEVGGFDVPSPNILRSDTLTRRVLFLENHRGCTLLVERRNNGMSLKTV